MRRLASAGRNRAAVADGRTCETGSHRGADLSGTARRSAFPSTRSRVSRRSSGRAWLLAAASLGDVGESSPDRWESTSGHPGRPCSHRDPLSGMPSSSRESLEKARRAYEQLNGIEVIWRQDCYQLPTGRTSFGFKDGIGQPAIEGSGIPGTNPLEIAHKSGRVHPRLPRRDRQPCRRCLFRKFLAGTGRIWRFGSCIPGWPSTVSTCGRTPQTGKRRGVWAPRWWVAGKAEPLWS